MIQWVRCLSHTRKDLSGHPQNRVNPGVLAHICNSSISIVRWEEVQEKPPEACRVEGWETHPSLSSDRPTSRVPWHSHTGTHMQTHTYIHVSHTKTPDESNLLRVTLHLGLDTVFRPAMALQSQFHRPRAEAHSSAGESAC